MPTEANTSSTVDHRNIDDGAEQPKIGLYPDRLWKITRLLNYFFFGLGLGLRIGVSGSVDHKCNANPKSNNNTNTTLIIYQVTPTTIVSVP